MNTVRTRSAVIADKIGLVLTVLICAALLAIGALNGANAATAPASVPSPTTSAPASFHFEAGDMVASSAGYTVSGQGGALAED